MLHKENALAVIGHLYSMMLPTSIKIQRVEAKVAVVYWKDEDSDILVFEINTSAYEPYSEWKQE